jgi:hypothetical protein
VQLKEKETLRQESGKKFDQAIEQFVKIDELLGGQGKLKMEEKQFLKDSYDLLITIYEQKQNTEKAGFILRSSHNVDKVSLRAGNVKYFKGRSDPSFFI